MPIPSPTVPDTHPDYQITCEEAIEDAVRASLNDLVDRVVAAGWKRDTAEVAVWSVARSLGTAYAEHPEAARG